MGQTSSTFDNIPKLSKKKLAARIKKLDHNNENILLVLPSTIIIEANKKAIDLLGATKKTIINKSIKNFLPKNQPHLYYSTETFLLEMGKKITKTKYRYLDIIFALKKLDKPNKDIRPPNDEETKKEDENEKGKQKLKKNREKERNKRNKKKKKKKKKRNKN
ncbi:hypothetical protein M0812_27549 [Anaeramoeba flamelloides]|uniref:Uncharacterized protein n=1 Tax=Anaeramoeba flamelloides TaxID=1746091 RepID=A0AAV7Y931_9EUKA|nr:hypothetical protein M0812_27549 [Anaeramoeba flamelloides]